MAIKKKEGPHCRVSSAGSTDFVGLLTALRLESKVLVLAMPVHGSQFNGKQEGQANLAHLTCAAPATVSRRVFIRMKTPLSSQTTGRSETGGWEGGEGRLCQPGYRPTR